MHGKTQNANESFNGTIWERTPKYTFVTLPNFEFDVYDGIAHCNIRMKVSVLICEKLNSLPVVYMLKGFKKRNLKRVNLVNQRRSQKNKLRRQILQGKKNVHYIYIYIYNVKRIHRVHNKYINHN